MKQSIIAGILGFSMLLSTPVAALANTGTTTGTDLQAQILKLQEQIKELTARISVLKGEVKTTNTELQSVRQELKIARQLGVGTKGDDVKQLQELLASDPDVYPEALITGYYGLLTMRAVQRYQRKYGIDAVGEVGPRTRQKMKEHWAEKFAKMAEKFEDKFGNGAGNSGRIPPGLFQNGSTTLPCGIAKKYGLTGTCRKDNDDDDDDDDDDNNNGTTTPDTIAPSISNLTATNVTGVAAKINWNTNESATGKVWYSTSNPVVIASTTATATQSGKSSAHSVNLSGLTQGTTYFYLVVSSDAAGNTATSSQQSFTTSSSSDTTAPVISNIQKSNITNTGASVSWNTNESADGKILYGTTSPVALATASTANEGSTGTSHTINLSGLTPGTTYYFLIVSKDGAGNAATSSEQSVMTTDTVAPVISAVSSSGITAAAASVLWNTNENADSTVWYSTTTPVAIGGGALSTTNASLVTAHSLGLTGLTASTTYYYLVVSKDGNGNAATSSESSFTTLGL